MADNPYSSMKNPERLGSHYVERQDDCGESLRELYENACNLCSKPGYVYGLHDMGKTSFAYWLKDALGRIPNRFVSYIDTEQIERVDGAAAQLIVKIEEFLVDSIRSVDDGFADFPSSPFLGRPEELGRLIKKIKTLPRHYTFTILIDNFCHQLHSQFHEKFYDTMVALISVLTQDENHRVIHLVFFARRSPEMVQNHTGASYLYGRCDPVALTPFTKEEVESLCRDSQTPVDAEGVRHCSGGNPQLAVLILEEKNRCDADLSEIVLRTKVSHAIKSNFRMLERFFTGFLDEDDTLQQTLTKNGITNCFEALIWRELYDTKIPQAINDEFESYGLGREHLPDSMKSLRTYLMQVTHVGSRLEKLVKLEKDLRKFINRRLCELYKKEDWFDDVVISTDENWDNKKRDIIKTIRGWQKRACEEYPDASTDPLDYAYPDDLWGLIEKVKRHWEGADGWKGFKLFFDNQEKQFARAMKAFSEIRNPEHHCRRPPDEVVSRFEEHQQFLVCCLGKAL